MAKEKKVEQITDMEVDFAQWFTDVCIKAELVDYSDVKGLFINLKVSLSLTQIRITKHEYKKAIW